MLWCYCDDDDNIKFVSARPKLLQGELDRAYTWPRSRIYGTTTRDLFLRNRFRKVETEEQTVEFSEKTDSRMTFNIYVPKRENNMQSPISISQFDENTDGSRFAPIETISINDDAEYYYYEFSYTPKDFTLLTNVGVNFSYKYYGLDASDEEENTDTSENKFVVFDPTGTGVIIPDDEKQYIGWKFAGNFGVNFFIPNVGFSEFYTKSKERIMRECNDGVQDVSCGLMYFKGKIYFALAIKKWRKMYSWDKVTTSFMFNLQYDIISPMKNTRLYNTSRLQ